MWQPIETAPKSETKMIIGYHKKMGVWPISWYEGSEHHKQKFKEAIEASGGIFTGEKFKENIPAGWYYVGISREDKNSIDLQLSIQPVYWHEMPPKPIEQKVSVE